VVQWPGGAAETFRGFAPDRRYVLVEGAAEPAAWSPPDRRVQLVPSKLEGAPMTTAGRVVLATPVKAPILTYADWDGQAHTINADPPTGKPTLINLWASWCLPCHVEIKELLSRQTSLRVVALSVDGLDETKATGPADARAHLDKIGFSFESGLASAEMLSKLQLLHDLLFFKVIPIGVPTSLLINGEGRLAVIYRGTIDVDELLADVHRLRAGPERRRQQAGRFPGRWRADPPSGMRLEMVGQDFEEEGFLDDALAYYREAIKVSPDDAFVHMKLGLCLKRQGHLDEAIGWYRRAVHLDPNYVQAHNNLGVALQAQGRLDEALPQYQRVLEIDPKFTTARYNLAIILLWKDKSDEAISHFRQAVEDRPYFAEAHMQLAAIPHLCYQTLHLAAFRAAGEH